MDYTSVARVKAHLRVAVTTDDALLAVLVTAASRAIDRRCTQAAAADVADYFALETAITETLVAYPDQFGVLHVWPHKPVVASVTALAYRDTPMATWSSIATDRIQVLDAAVAAWPTATLLAMPYTAQITYSGGYATTVEGLPADLVEAATVLAARYYREAETGLTDALGIVEIGQLVYTKAIPERVADMLEPFKRRIPW